MIFLDLTVFELRTESCKMCKFSELVSIVVDRASIFFRKYSTINTSTALFRAIYANVLIQRHSVNFFLFNDFYTQRSMDGIHIIFTFYVSRWSTHKNAIDSSNRNVALLIKLSYAILIACKSSIRYQQRITLSLFSWFQSADQFGEIQNRKSVGNNNDSGVRMTYTCALC